MQNILKVKTQMLSVYENARGINRNLGNVGENM